MLAYAEFLKEWNNDSPFVEARTSGSTGAPKRILLQKTDMLVSARATNAFFGINSGSVLAIPLSCDYIAGKMMAVRAMEADCSLWVIPPKNDFNLDELASCRDWHIDLISVVPSQVDCLIRHPEWAARIGAIIVGGSALSRTRSEAVKSAGYNAFVSYGMTETCSHVALSKAGEPFQAMPGITFSVDSRNCLVIDVPKMSIRKIVTNDVVSLLDSHTFIWRGRYDNVINSGGIKIFPESLEKEISKFLEVDFYIVGIPDEKWGEAVQMVVEADENSRTAIEEALKNEIDHKFLPKSLHFVRMLERTNNGKLLRKAYYQ